MGGKIVAVIAGTVVLAGAVILFVVFRAQPSPPPAPLVSSPEEIPATIPPPPEGGGIEHEASSAPPINPIEPISPTDLPPPAPPTPKTPPSKTPPPPREPREFVAAIKSLTEVAPANLEIHVGDTVTFINEDTQLHWPGADPHPTHSSLPTFDALGGISPGQSYSHTFRTEGKFGYHEHLLDNPPTLGIITVLP